MWAKKLSVLTLCACAAHWAFWSMLVAYQAPPNWASVADARYQAIDIADLSQIDPAQWLPVTLPARLCPSPGCPGQFKVVRVDFDAAPSKEVQAVYMLGLRHAAKVYVNTQLVAQIGSIAPLVSNHENKPHFVTYPGSLLRPGTNHLEVIIGERKPGFALLRQLYIGPAQSLAQHWRTAQFLQVEVVSWTFWGTVLAAVFALGYFRVRRLSLEFMWFAALATFLSLRSLQHLANGLPPNAETDYLAYALATMGALLCGYGFVRTWCGYTLNRTEMFIMTLGFLFVGYVGIALYVDYRDTSVLCNQVIRHIAPVILALCLFNLIKFALTHWHWRNTLVLVALSITTATAVHAVLITWPPSIGYTYVQLGIVPLLLAFVVDLTSRVRTTFDTADRAQDNLALKLDQQAHELQDQHQQLMASQRERELETERRRIMQDVHDGVGGKLSTLVLRLEAQNLGNSEVVDAINASLRDLRLVINSIDPGATSANQIEAQLRTWFNQHNISLNWQCADDSLAPLSPTARLQLFRIIEEACANVIKHAAADAVTIHIALIADKLVATVHDNGKGMPATDNRPTYGHQNMQDRAALLGGSVEISFDSGTLVEVHVPISSADGNAEGDSVQRDLT